MTNFSDDDDVLAAEGRTVRRVMPDGREMVAVGLCLASHLSDEERALTIHEGFMAAKALLCAKTLH